MDWEPIAKEVLLDKINSSIDRMTSYQINLWEIIKIPPQKWREETNGELGGGFWAVAIIGSSVIWYNDIEEGFNRSSYSEYGKIDEYWCDQDELEWRLQKVLNQLSH